MKILFLSLLSVLILAGCSKTATEHRAEVEDSTTDKITVGNVQREVRTGMSGAEIASILGSPNTVSTDTDRNEVWVYDKMSTTTASSSNYFLFSPAGAISSNQKTLTVIIKFDKNKEVRDFSYRQSSF